MIPRTVIALTIAAISIMAITASMNFPAKVIWNASGSVPIGLYALHPAGRLHASELVAVIPPEPLASFLARRGYLPKGVPLLKHILALAGQIVCRSGRTITVDGIAAGQALRVDRRGRSLPCWQGCHVIPVGEVFLMNEQRPDSLDSRYFGPLPTSAITGRADPLWTHKD